MADKLSNVLKFNTPARWWGELWREGLYLGNGKLGANLYGGACEERILINDASLSWLGRTTVVPDISDKILVTKKRIEEGDFIGAQGVMPTALMQKNFRPQTEFPLPICQLNMNFSQSGATTEYMRALDMENGEATVSYAVDDTKYKRNMFVSREDNIIAYRVTKQGAGSISLKLSLSLIDASAGDSADSVKMLDGVEMKYDRQFATFAARNPDNGTDYGVVAKLHVLGGSIRPEQDHVEIVRAQSILILIKTFTNGIREREFTTLKARLTLVKDGYEKLFKTHAAIHSKLYNSVSVSLCESQQESIEQMLFQAETGEMPASLTEKIYKYGRYLTIACTPDEGSAKLLIPVGLWNGGYTPARAYTSASGEMQMSYMHTLQGNLSFNMEKSFDYFWNNLDDYRNNAQRIFGCRGIVVPVVAAPNTGRLGSTDVFAVHFSGCAAYVANLYYKYAKISQNTRFLKTRLIPFMKEIALFYDDFIKFIDNGLEISPSALPLRIADSATFTDRPVVAKNSVLDYELAKDLLTNLIEACALCNVKGSADAWQKLIDAMPDKQIASDGSFREFINSIISVDYTGVSNGTLYPAYFGDEVSWLSDPEIVDLYLTTAEKKRNDAAAQNSYNMTVLGAVYARLADGNGANTCLTNAVRGCAMNNLAFVDKDWRDMGICGSGNNSPVQLNVNMTFTHVVQQMLMYSHGDVIRIFPAIPDSWGNVKFSQFVAENNVVVHACQDFDKGKFTVKLESKKEAHVHLYVPDYVKKLVKSPFAKNEKPSGKNFELTIPANKAIFLQYKL
ncbi:MAG: glycoside hydrolase N-terminal domain-containing protein [Clostridiales bacterium]|nr:glycoside hydrolase N-terminal domain-containing protein [Clostridiales bacterium]